MEYLVIEETDYKQEKRSEEKEAKKRVVKPAHQARDESLITIMWQVACPGAVLLGPDSQADGKDILR